MENCFIVQHADCEDLVKVLKNDPGILIQFADFIEALLNDPKQTSTKIDLIRENNTRADYGKPFSDVLRKALRTWVGIKGKKLGTVQELLIILNKCELTAAFEAVDDHWKEKYGVAPQGFDIVRKIAFGEVGITYRQLFEKLADSTSTTLRLEDTYSALPHQIENFKEFVKTAAERWPKLTSFTLRALAYTNGMEVGLREMIKEVEDQYKQIKFHLEPVTGSKQQATRAMHGRFLKVGNNWEVYLDRGLDIYVEHDGDHDKRTCKEAYVIYSSFDTSLEFLQLHTVSSPTEPCLTSSNRKPVLEGCEPLLGPLSVDNREFSNNLVDEPEVIKSGINSQLSDLWEPPPFAVFLAVLIVVFGGYGIALISVEIWKYNKFSNFHKDDFVDTNFISTPQPKSQEYSSSTEAGKDYIRHTQTTTNSWNSTNLIKYRPSWNNLASISFCSSSKTLLMVDYNFLSHEALPLPEIKCPENVVAIEFYNTYPWSWVIHLLDKFHFLSNIAFISNNVCSVDTSNIRHSKQSPKFVRNLEFRNISIDCQSLLHNLQETIEFHSLDSVSFHCVHLTKNNLFLQTFLSSIQKISRIICSNEDNCASINYSRRNCSIVSSHRLC